MTDDDVISVLCVEDHRIVREGLALIIDRQPDMVVVASAATGEDGVELFATHHPNVTLMDLRLGASMSGVDTIRSIRRIDASARIIMLTMYEGDQDVHRAMDAGAAAYLLKDTLSDDLIRTVRDVHAGRVKRRVPAVRTQVANRVPGSALTPREVNVIELISQGRRNKEIAAHLGIAESTVQVHVKHILAKLSVNDRTAALTEALRRGILHIP